VTGKRYWRDKVSPDITFNRIDLEGRCSRDVPGALLDHSYLAMPTASPSLDSCGAASRQAREMIRPRFTGAGIQEQVWERSVLQSLGGLWPAGSRAPTQNLLVFIAAGW